MSEGDDDSLGLEARLDPVSTRRLDEVASTALRGARTAQDDVDARRWRAAVEQRLFGGTGARQAIGRYTILSKLGEGAHGVVYEAFDPELERAVALKLVELDLADDDAGSERLLREARALARLEHPHVVAVHDAGRDSVGVFIAMELVEGTTLRQWMASGEPRRLDHILDVFAQAGEGLVAAHRRGIVHRDFKPENVLVGNDGRVRVSDFGLARVRAPEAEDTLTHGIVGTPAYMAPEQQAGRAADPRSDQFSFCVTLFEALHGGRPDLRRIAGELEIGGARRIPRWLRRLVRRGLSHDPEARFENMEQLLRTLDRGRERTRRAKTVTVLLVVIFCAAAIVAALSNDRVQLCDPSEASALWSDDTAEQSRRAFRRSGVADAEQIWSRIDVLARDRVNGWSALASDVCTGTTEEDRARALCLGWQLQELRAFGTLMTSADARVVSQALIAVHELPDPSRCGIARWDLAAVTGQAHGDADQVHALVADARVRLEAGQLVEALRDSTTALERAQSLGSRPLEAEALLVRGRAAAALHGSQEASTIDPETTLYAAMLAAEAGRHSFVQAEAMVELTIWVVGLRRFDSARMWSERAFELLAQTPTESRLAARLHWGLSTGETWQNRLDAAEGHLQQAFDLLEDDPSDPLSWRFHNQRGEIAYARADYVAARLAYEHSLALTLAHLGSEHLWIADAHGNLGEVATAEHRLDDALRHFETAVDIRRRTLGPHSYWVMHTLAHLGDVYRLAGDLDRAVSTYEAVVSGPGGDDPAACDRHVWARNGLALVALERGATDRALRLTEQTRHASPKEDPSHLDLCDRLDVYALALLAHGRAQEALHHLERARAQIQASAGAEHRAMTPVLVAEAETQYALGQLQHARDSLERAMVIDTRDPTTPDVSTRARALHEKLRSEAR